MMVMMPAYHSLWFVWAIWAVLVARGYGTCGRCLPHRPLNSANHLVSYISFQQTANHLMFPEVKTPATQHFFNAFNFDDAPDGTFFIGGRDALYEINKNSFEAEKTYTWSANAAAEATCMNNARDPDIACKNYIRLYKKLPFENADDRLLVCGTGAYKVACRTLDRMNITSEAGEGPPTPTLDIGIISLDPLIPFAGDFLDDPTLGYQTTGYTKSPALTTFDFARYDVSYDNSTKAIDFISVPSRTIQSTYDFHIKAPYLPVKLIKQNFNNEEKFKMFYFFIRERKFYGQVSDAVPVRARIIRVCQQDDGLDIQANNPFFKTYIKAEMLCFGDPPNTPRAVGAQEHYYTVLRDVVQTDYESRWNGNDQVWHKLVYGVFTGDVYGPNGTAICVYHAHFSANNLLFADDRGIVDAFNFNNFRDAKGEFESQENLLNCDSANARVGTEADHIIAVDAIRPYNGLSLPLVETEGEIITKIATQQVCVRTPTDPAVCLMQDVLFVGTSNGRVKKIVFSTIASSDDAELDGLTHDAIVAQEWELADENSIEQLIVEDDDLYVATYTHIYKFPVANCSRHGSCTACLGSRDPHCYWNTINGMCEKNDIGTVDVEGSFAFDTSYKQSIHTGEDVICGDYPNCTLTFEATAADTIEVSGLSDCSNTNSFSVAVEPYDNCKADSITSTLSDTESTIQNNNIRGRRLYNVIVVATGDNGDSTYSDYVFTPDGAPVAPTDSELSARAINSSHVELAVGLDGCNIHDEIQNHQICVTFTDSSNNNHSSCQTFSGVNTFVSGAYQGSESISYSVTVTNDLGTAVTSTPGTVNTLASIPNPPADVTIVSRTADSVSLMWTAGDNGFNEVTGYSLLVDGVKRTDCSTENTVYTLYGLYSYTNYNLSVATCGTGGESDPNTTSVTTKCDRPSPIRSLNVQTQGPSSLLFEWESPMYINGTEPIYRVIEQCYNKSSLMIEEFVENINSTNHLILDLDPLTRCCIAVSAISTCDGSKLYSESELLCNITSDDIPGQVEDLTVSSPNPTSLLVTWSVPDNYSNPSLVYEVTWKTTDSLLDSYIVLDVLYYYIHGLNQSTVYTVTLTAMSGVGSGPQRSISYETGDDVPTAPEDVTIQFNDCDMQVSWTHDDKDEYHVNGYNIRAHCNREDYEETTFQNDMSVTIDICKDSDPVLSWCIAQVQAVNDIGNGPYSSWVDAVFPQATPTTPHCFLAENIGSLVAISYTLTAPYSLNDLTVSYTLDPLPASAPPNDFFDGNNTLVFRKLDRSISYSFSLMLCYGGSDCSPPCELTFTPSQVPPNPPSAITTVEILDNQFTISWEHPVNENPAFLRYAIHVTGNSQSFYVNATGTNTTIDNLLANAYYYYVIRSVDVNAQLIGTYSESRSVLTAQGRPPVPIISNAEYLDRGDDTSTLTVCWGLPEPLNGSVSGFDVAWSSRLPLDCERTYSTVEQFQRISDSNIRFIKLTNPQGFTATTRVPDEGYMCIRSLNSASQASDWAIAIFPITTIMPITEAVSTNNEAQDIGILSAVILLAIIAITIAVILVIVLVVVIIKYKPFARDGSVSHNHDSNGNEVIDGEVSDWTNSSNARTPPKRIESTRSTTSRTVMIRNSDDNEKSCCKLA